MIGDDVWICYRTTVMGAITIGPGAVIGSRAVVVNDAPPYAVVVGVPAKVLRMRFDAETVERLSRVRWWDWPPATVQGAHGWFSRPVAEFLRHFHSAREPGIRSPAGEGRLTRTRNAQSPGADAECTRSP